MLKGDGYDENDGGAICADREMLADDGAANS